MGSGREGGRERSELRGGLGLFRPPPRCLPTRHDWTAPLFTGWRDDVVAADAVRVHGGLLDDGNFGLPPEPHDAVLGHHRHQSALGVLRKKEENR